MKSLWTNAQTSVPNANAVSTNCPATAGTVAAIQRGLPRAGPAMPKNACANGEQQREDQRELSEFG